MASAVLASQNDSGWGHMGKTPYSNPHLNGNPNPNPKKKQKQFHHPPQTASSVVITTTSYLTFNVASYTKSELFELRKRLSAELEQIRDLRDRIESRQFNIVENPRSQPKLKKFPGNKRPIPRLGLLRRKLASRTRMEV
ncbi:UNVERIFIED_CONTAM: hypothetical protein Sradi_2832400 [Sesamum radiatum]|uniref:Uncharacterized protein n=1 Tax=Sesamum radiatum TaxID=300843 RepID=A0AAW2RVP8_SESRA